MNGWLSRWIARRMGWVEEIPRVHSEWDLDGLRIRCLDTDRYGRGKWIYYQWWTGTGWNVREHEMPWSEFRRRARPLSAQWMVDRMTTPAPGEE
jgi:hypothetical protein